MVLKEAARQRNDRFAATCPYFRDPEGKSMHAVQLVSRRPGELGVESVVLPGTLLPGSAVVRAETTAVSAGTEIAHYLGRTTQRPADGREPYFPGYCFAGVIERVGPECTGLEVGQRVTGPFPHASVVVADAAQLVHVPDGVPAADAALSQLGCIALNGLRAASVQLGEHVAVVGAGLVGLLAARLAYLAGGRGLVVVDPIEERRRVAAGFVPADSIGPEEAAGRSHQFPVVVEATGSPAAVA